MIEKISLNLNLFENSLPFCCRDKKALDDWREKTKLLRQQKQRLSAVKGSSKGKASSNFSPIRLSLYYLDALKKKDVPGACSILNALNHDMNFTWDLLLRYEFIEA